jgi:hypothetical protein
MPGKHNIRGGDGGDRLPFDKPPQTAKVLRFPIKDRGPEAVESKKPVIERIHDARDEIKKKIELVKAIPFEDQGCARCGELGNLCGDHIAELKELEQKLRKNISGAAVIAICKECHKCPVGDVCVEHRGLLESIRQP